MATFTAQPTFTPAIQSPSGAGTIERSNDPVALRVAAQEYGLDFIDLTPAHHQLDLIQQFPSNELFRRCLLPIETDGRIVHVATCDPFDWESFNELAVLTGFTLVPVLAIRSQIEQALKTQLGVGGGTVLDLVGQTQSQATEREDQHAVDDDSQSSSVVKLVNEILLEAIQQRASDIHLEPDENLLDVRYRVDGLLRTQPMPAEIHRFRAAILSRLKIMAKLNIAEKRLPQDGRIQLTVAGREIDLRVSIMPMLHGEAAVLRLLDKSRGNLSLGELDLPTEVEQSWRTLIQRPHGLILVTGPTGSGKTSTLYSSLAEVAGRDKKIITIEDPVEYQLRGVSQIQVQSKIGLTFAAGLRGILRHDPDVILVGEIRDHETAVSAVQASLTGHLVLSTLHTNDAIGAYPRLMDMQIEPYLVAGTLEAVLAQRLVRRLCVHCREPRNNADSPLPADFPEAPDAMIWQASGCRACGGTGYSGRVGVFELLVSSPEMRQLCTGSSCAADLKREATSRGFRSLRQHGWTRVLEGQTSVDEVLRVCAHD